MVYSLINPSLTEGKHVLAKSTDTEIISFVDVILGLSREENIDLYVTGSNSKMLSTDIITAFRDKATTIALAPISFEEYFGYVGGSANDAIYEYMQFGGMPLAILKKDEEKKESLDKQTVEKYIRFFKEAFILREARRYDLKGRAEIGALRKYYFVDTGLRNARLNFAFPDEGQMLENIVFNELCYKGYTVNVGCFDTVEKDRNGKSIRKSYEVDFYATKGLKRYYIQVCTDISNAKTRAREGKP